MAEDRAQRWFHTIVVVGAALTACGSREGLDVPGSADGGDADRASGDSGGSSGSSRKGATDAAATDAAVVAQDASGLREASAAPDGSATCCSCPSNCYCVAPDCCPSPYTGAPVCTGPWMKYCQGCIQ